MRPLLKNLKLVASSTCVYAFCVLFPTVASCSESGKSIDDVLPPMEADSSSTAIEQRIVMVEQSQHQVIIVDRESGETLWTWNAAQSGLSREEQKWFELPDEVKPIYNGKYLLVLHQSDYSPEEFNKVCNILSEYGKGKAFTAAGEAHLKEHGSLITQNALQQLVQL